MCGLTFTDARDGTTDSLTWDVSGNAVTHALHGISSILSSRSDRIASAACGSSGDAGDVTLAESSGSVADRLAQPRGHSRRSLADVAGGVYAWVSIMAM